MKLVGYLSNGRITNTAWVSDDAPVYGNMVVLIPAKVKKETKKGGDMHGKALYYRRCN